MNKTLLNGEVLILKIFMILMILFKIQTSGIMMVTDGNSIVRVL